MYICILFILECIFIMYTRYPYLSYQNIIIKDKPANHNNYIHIPIYPQPIPIISNKTIPHSKPSQSDPNFSTLLNIQISTKLSPYSPNQISLDHILYFLLTLVLILLVVLELSPGEPLVNLVILLFLRTLSLLLLLRQELQQSI